MKKVLIVAYKFPPMGNIGTRRWAKFSKYLALSGYEVFVLARKYPYKDLVNWNHDVKHENIKISYFEDSYPTKCLKTNKTFLEKVFCKVVTIFRNKILNKLDIADNNSDDFFEKANKLIRENSIKNLIVTGPPHSFLYSAAILKSENPFLNMIVDYRDPWNYNLTYTLKALSSFKAKESSLKKETEVVKLSNQILCVTEDMTKNLQNLYPESANKINTIYNGYDVDDYSTTASINSKDEIIILYAGRLAQSRMKALELIAETLEKNSFSNLKVVLYSNINLNKFSNSKYYKTIEKYFEFNALVSQSEIYNKISQCDICLSINSLDNSHAFGSKIFDYMALKKTIWHISDGGELFELLENNNQIVSNYTIESTIKAIEQIQKNTKGFVVNFEEFNIKKLIQQVEKLLK